MIIREIKIFDTKGKEIDIQNSSFKYYSSEVESFSYKMPIFLKKDNYIVFSCEDIVLPSVFTINIRYTDPLNKVQEYIIKYKKKKRIVLKILTV